MPKGICMVLMLSCVLLAGCHNPAPLISKDASLTPETEKDNTLFPTVAPDWSNWIGFMQGGVSGNLWADADGMPMLDGQVKTEQGRLSVFLNSTWDAQGYTDAGMANILYMVAVNDEICNFTWNGKPSEQGILWVKNIELQKNHTDSLVVQDCNLVQGENTFAVCQVAYFPNIGHAYASGMKRSFLSEETKSQTARYTLMFEDCRGAEKSTEELNIPANGSVTEVLWSSFFVTLLANIFMDCCLKVYL